MEKLNKEPVLREDEEFPPVTRTLRGYERHVRDNGDAADLESKEL